MLLPISNNIQQSRRNSYCLFRLFPSLFSLSTQYTLLTRFQILQPNNPARLSNPHFRTISMSCPLLTQLRALPIDSLIASAENLLDSAQLQTMYKAHDSALTISSTARLAELVYYRSGSNLAAQQEWNEMTRLQLEHELRLRGCPESGEMLTDWKLRLRLAGAALAEKQETEKSLLKESKLKIQAVEHESDNLKPKNVN